MNVRSSLRLGNIFLFLLQFSFKLLYAAFFDAYWASLNGLEDIVKNLKSKKKASKKRAPPKQFFRFFIINQQYKVDFIEYNSRKVSTFWIKCHFNGQSSSHTTFHGEFTQLYVQRQCRQSEVSCSHGSDLHRQAVWINPWKKKLCVFFLDITRDFQDIEGNFKKKIATF